MTVPDRAVRPAGAAPVASDPAMPVPELPVEPLSPDTVWGAFSDHGPWVLDLDAIPWQWDIDRIRRGTRREVPRLLASGRLPPLGRLGRTLVEIGGALGGWLVFEWRRPSSRAGISRRLRTGVRTARVELREARPDHLRRRGALPRRAGQRVQAAARPGAAGAVRRRAGGGRDRPRRLARGAVRVVRRDAHRGGVDRPGARGPAAHRRRGRGQGAAAAGRAALPRRHRRAVVAGAPAGRAHPGGRAGQPAGAGRAVRRDGHRGARLPARGAEHARHRARARRDRPARDHRAPPAPHARHPAGAGDGAARRLRVRRRRVDARRRASTRTRCCRPGSSRRSKAR